MFKSQFFILVLASLLIGINAECRLNVKGDAPSFTKQFRRRTITLPRSANGYTLKSGEQIDVHCSKGLILSNEYGDGIRANDGVLNIQITCSVNGKIQYMKLDSRSNYLQNMDRSTVEISCAQGLQIYESDTSLSNCQNYTSIGIGTVLQGSKQIVAAAICFDFDTLTAKYVKYVAGRPKFTIFTDDSQIEENTTKTSIIELSTAMEGFEVLFNDLNQKNFETKFEAMQENNQFLSYQEFEYVSLLQDHNMDDDLKEFEYFLNTIWWRNLRLGNWQFFLNALKERSERVKYTIYTGTSGQLLMPSISRCREEEVFRINNFDSSFRVPEIIWAYVKPLVANERDEFVVVGYNTPFYSRANETVSCMDICNEIDWLQKSEFGRLNLFPAFGVVHCCRPAEVASQLDTFPMGKLSKKPVPTEKPQVQK